MPWDSGSRPAAFSKMLQKPPLRVGIIFKFNPQGKYPVNASFHNDFGFFCGSEVLPNGNG